MKVIKYKSVPGTNPVSRTTGTPNTINVAPGLIVCGRGGTAAWEGEGLKVATSWLVLESNIQKLAIVTAIPPLFWIHTPTWPAGQAIPVQGRIAGSGLLGGSQDLRVRLSALLAWAA